MSKTVWRITEDIVMYLNSYLRVFLFLVPMFVLASCSSTDTSCKTSSLDVLTAQVVDQAEGAETAESALEALRKGDNESAIAVLEGQLQGSMLILNSSRPKLTSKSRATSQQLQMVDQAIADGNKYIADQKGQPKTHQ